MPRLRKLAEFSRRAAPKLSEGLRLMGRVARERAAPAARESARQLLTFSKEKIVPKAKESAYRSAEFARQTLAPRAKKNAALLLALMRRAAERGVPAAKKSVKTMGERVVPAAWELAKREIAPRMVVAGKEAKRLIVERGAPAAKNAALTAYEKTLIAARTRGKTGWRRGVEELSVKTGLKREDLTRALYTMVKQGKIGPRQALSMLREIHEAAGSREMSRTAIGIMHREVSSGVDPRVAHAALKSTLELVRKNPELARKIDQIYRLARAQEFLRQAEPPTPEEIERMRMSDLKALLTAQHPKGFAGQGKTL